jgi:hypothetical protein
MVTGRFLLSKIGAVKAAGTSRPQHETQETLLLFGWHERVSAWPPIFKHRMPSSFGVAKTGKLRAPRPSHLPASTGFLILQP